jgi:hypothetical protein
MVVCECGWPDNGIGCPKCTFSPHQWEELQKPERETLRALFDLHSKVALDAYGDLGEEGDWLGSYERVGQLVKGPKTGEYFQYMPEGKGDLPYFQVWFFTDEKFHYHGWVQYFIHGKQENSGLDLLESPEFLQMIHPISPVIISYWKKTKVAGKTRSLSEKEYRTHHQIGFPVEDRDAILRKLRRGEGPWHFTLSYELDINYTTTTSAKEFQDELVSRLMRFRPIHEMFFEPVMAEVRAEQDRIERAKEKEREKKRKEKEKEKDKKKKEREKAREKEKKKKKKVKKSAKGKKGKKKGSSKKKEKAAKTDTKPEAPSD